MSQKSLTQIATGMFPQLSDAELISQLYDFTDELHDNFEDRDGTPFRFAATMIIAITAEITARGTLAITPF